MENEEDAKKEEFYLNRMYHLINRAWENGEQNNLINAMCVQLVACVACWDGESKSERLKFMDDIVGRIQESYADLLDREYGEKVYDFTDKETKGTKAKVFSITGEA